MSERDYSNKYFITSGETQFTVQMEESGMLSGASGHEQWRIMERVQWYSSKDVQKYRCTDKCCYREDGGSWFYKKGPKPELLRIV
jgi:hypothetical protein